MKKIIAFILISTMSLSAFAHSQKRSRNNNKILTSKQKKIVKLVEEAYDKPFVIGSYRFSTRNFDYERLKNKSVFGKKDYLGIFFKNDKLGLIETKNAVSLVRENDLPKSEVKVFKDKIPENLHEQYITFIKTLPKNLDNKEVDRTLRSSYSRAGDLKAPKGNNKIIVSDWLSNVRRLNEIMDNL